ncbi:MAG: peptidylprolyl isomerase [Motiliproteus sp.]
MAIAEGAPVQELGSSIDQGRAVVQINGVVISYAKLDRAVANYIQQRQLDPAQTAKDSPVYKGIRQSLLNEFIGQELLWQEAMKSNKISTEQQVEQALNATSERFPDKDSFVANLNANGFTEASFTQDLIQRLSVQRLINDEIVSKVKVADQEVKTFYAANTERFKRPEQFHIRHILISPANDGGEEARAQARATLANIHAEIQAGGDFAELAKQHSQDPAAAKGGDLGFVSRGQLVPAFEAAALALTEGQVSGPVETPYGYHLIKLEQQRPAEALPEQEALSMIEQRLRALKVDAAIKARMLDLWTAGRVELMGPV